MKNSSTFLAPLITALAFTLSLSHSAIASNDASDTSAAAKPSASAPRSDGEVKKVDKETGKITIKHGPLINLDMPGMTMIFRVKDPAMLEKVKTGDKIKFVADKVNGALTVTTLQVER